MTGRGHAWGRGGWSAKCVAMPLQTQPDGCAEVLTHRDERGRKTVWLLRWGRCTVKGWQRENRRK